MASHTVYAVASGKGGVGKTTTTVNLGASLAEAGHKVVIVDADLGMANLGGFIGVDPDATLHEVLAGDASLEEATYEALNGLAVVPSGISLNGFANVETAALSDAVGALREAFDYVILDLGAGLSHDTVLPLALADAVILVSTPQPAAVQDTAKTREITERLGGRVAGVVLTRAGGAADLDLDEIGETLDLPVLAMLPEDDAVPRSAREGKAVLQYDPESPVAEGYRGLAGIVEAESLDDAPVIPEPHPESGAATDDEPADAEGEAPVEADAEASTGAHDADAEAEAESTATGGAAEGDASTEDAVEAAADGSAEATTPGDPDTTAAEIAAAIEEAASGVETPSAETGGGEAPSHAASEPADAEGDGGPPTVAESETAAAGGADAADDGESSPADDEVDAPDPGTDRASAETVAEAADEAEAEPEAFKVESSEEPPSAEEEAVDELFSVEGADPDELEDEEEDDEDSGGLFSRFFG